MPRTNGRVGPKRSTRTPIGRLIISTPILCEPAINPSIVLLLPSSTAYSEAETCAMPTVVPINDAKTANVSKNRLRSMKSATLERGPPAALAGSSLTKLLDPSAGGIA